MDEIYFPLEINDLTIFEKYYRIKLFQLANRVFLKPYKDNINCKKFLKEFGKLISEIKEVWVSRYHFSLQSSKTDARGNTPKRNDSLRFLQYRRRAFTYSRSVHKPSLSLDKESYLSHTLPLLLPLTRHRRSFEMHANFEPDSQIYPIQGRHAHNLEFFESFQLVPRCKNLIGKI